jgi:hypothetical protein
MDANAVIADQTNERRMIVTVFVDSPTQKIRRVITGQVRANLDVIVVARDHSKVAGAFVRPDACVTPLIVSAWPLGVYRQSLPGHEWYVVAAFLLRVHKDQYSTPGFPRCVTSLAPSRLVGGRRLEGN